MRSGSAQTISTQTDSSFTLAKGLSKDYYFTLNNKTVKDKEQDQVQAFAELKNGAEAQPASLALTGIRYDHIPYIQYFYQDAVKVLNIDLKTEGKRIGYIEGAGDKVPEALEEMGYEVVLLKEKDIYPVYLKQFDAILTGIRAYNVHDFLAQKYDILMNYVKERRQPYRSIQYDQFCKQCQVEDRALSIYNFP